MWVIYLEVIQFIAYRLINGNDVTREFRIIIKQLTIKPFPLAIINSLKWTILCIIIIGYFLITFFSNSLQYCFSV